MGRPFTPTEQTAWNAMQLRAQEAAPYLTTALLSLQPVAEDGLGTFAVDAYWRCYVDPAQFVVWSPEHQAGVLIHEVSHLLRDHHGRAAAHGVTEHTLWNASGDAGINDDLLDMGVPLPEGITTDTLGVPSGLTAEAVYDLLVAQQPPSGGQSQQQSGGGQPGNGQGAGQGQPGDGQDAGQGQGQGAAQDAAQDAWDGGCGSGSGGMAAPVEQDAPDTPGTASGIDAADAELLRRKVAEDVRSFSGGRGRGDAPGSWRRWADDTLAPTPVPWQQVLNAAVSRTATLVAGRTDTSYRRRSNRRLPGVILPGNVRPKPSLGTVIDTSGSMSDAQVQTALEEVQGIIRRVGLRGREHVVLTVDAAVHGPPQPVTDARRITMGGGGGTDMRIGITALAEQRNAPAMCLVLTDGYTPWPDHRPPKGMRLIIGLIGDHDRLDSVADSCPEWATVVKIAVDRDGNDLPAAA